jgi:hypothetical protein
MPATDKDNTITDPTYHPPTNKPQKEQHRLQKRNRQQLLKRPCTCGRTYGWHQVVRVRRPSTKSIMDVRGERIPKEIKTKYTSRDRGPSEAYWAVKERQATMKTIAEMLPFVSKRYPSLLIREADYAKAFRVENKILKPWGDERFSMDWISWWLISMDACTYTYNAAASRNAVEVRMPNGKIRRIKLTPEYIRDRLDVTYELACDVITYLPAYIEFLDVWNYIVNNDKVVKAEFLRRFEENKKIIVIPPKGYGGTTIANDGQLERDSYDYQYHYMMHFDPELYKQNKKTQGKVRCGPFTESEIRSFF